MHVSVFIGKENMHFITYKSATPIIFESLSSMFFFFQPMEVRTKLKMTGPNFEVREMKSSKELRKKVKIKRERIISIGGVTNGPKFLLFICGETLLTSSIPLHYILLFYQLRLALFLFY